MQVSRPALPRDPSKKGDEVGRVGNPDLAGINFRLGSAHLRPPNPVGLNIGERHVGGEAAIGADLARPSERAVGLYANGRLALLETALAAISNPRGQPSAGFDSRRRTSSADSVQSSFGSAGPLVENNPWIHYDAEAQRPRLTCRAQADHLQHVLTRCDTCGQHGGTPKGSLGVGPHSSHEDAIRVRNA
jgi:hypothetical protein